MFEEIVDHLLELFDSVLPVHLVEDVVVASLHRYVNKGEDSGMVEEMSNRAQLIQHVGRVGHSYLPHN